MSIYLKDLITVIVTTYNPKLKYLEECLDSIIKQTYKKIEILVVDDNSVNFLEILNLIKSRYVNYKIKILRNKINSGVAHSLNRAIKHSKGKYINWCSYDDYFIKDKIMRQYKATYKTKSKIISCDYLIKYENYNIYRYSKSSSITKKFSFLFNDIYNGGTFLIPRHIFNLVDGFNVKLRHIQDYDLWLRLLLLNVEFKNLNQPLFVSRQHQEQHSFLDQNRAFTEKSKFYKKYIIDNIFNFFYFLNAYKIYVLIFSLISRGYVEGAEIIINSFIKFKNISNFQSKFVKLFYYFIFGFAILNKNIKEYLKNFFFNLVAIHNYFKN
jgi:glycosyltransferase involved in cell wall biosynthesis